MHPHKDNWHTPTPTFAGACMFIYDKRMHTGRWMNEWMIEKQKEKSSKTRFRAVLWTKRIWANHLTTAPSDFLISKTRRLMLTNGMFATCKNHMSNSGKCTFTHPSVNKELQWAMYCEKLRSETTKYILIYVYSSGHNNCIELQHTKWHFSCVCATWDVCFKVVSCYVSQAVLELVTFSLL